MVIGSGPAGLFAGLLLAQMGYEPIILERGLDVDSRTKDISDFWTTRKLKIIQTFNLEKVEQELFRMVNLQLE